MSRSTDGGQTWEPMKVIMDMGEWGGRSQRLNGIGDPCILYDEKTGTIWVAALWMSGATEKDMLWWASKPGMKPDETGQFIIVKSTDDGKTWSQPINITSQIKDPAWQLLLQGPGMGITLKDGTLVFPAQFKADIGTKSLDGGQYTCHSTIVYSKDQGNTWHIGTGAKSNTTEAQVVELTNGSLMLNMRDDRNRKDKSESNGRAVAVTKDLGKTWTVHPSSNSALQESNCMASIISAEIEIGGKSRKVLFFSNPNDKEARKNMTIKTSLDGGLTWPGEYQVLLNSETGYGYSCMSMIDNKTIGIVYEGVKELYFQKIPLNDLMGDRTK
jgi:sialidase-1